MKLAKDQPFWTAVILHVVVLLALFLATIIEYFRPEEDVHVFEIVSASAPSPAVAEPVNSTEPPPDIAPLDFAPLPTVPTVEIPPPQQTPPPKPQPTRPVESKPKPQMMTYEDFLKNNKIREPRQQQPVRPTVTATPQISIPQVSVPIASSSPHQAQPTAAQQNLLNQYTSQLSARLYRAWQQPSSLGGLNLRVKVSFYVSAGGQISRVKLAPASGNAAFDRSVLAAFRTVGNVGPTPTGQGYTWSIDFEMGQ